MARKVAISLASIAKLSLWLLSLPAAADVAVVLVVAAAVVLHVAAAVVLHVVAVKASCACPGDSVQPEAEDWDSEG